jgi:hypothetical protein
MDPITLNALLGSIAKWRGIVDQTTVDEGPTNCPLCRQFINEEHPDYTEGTPEDVGSAPAQCWGCPVQAKVFDTGCDKTPYMEYSRLERLYGALDNRTLAAAQLELDFLLSLLPVELKDLES